MPADDPGRVDYSRLDKTAFPQPRMNQLSAAVIGAGALGNEVVKALALIGFGRILIVDPDTVEPSNLTRSVFFSYYNRVGKNKADVLAEVCADLFRDTAFLPFPVEIADVGFQDLKTANLLFSCVDSDLARLEIAFAAAKLDLPVADAGLGADNDSHGRISWFAGRSAACYSCMLSRQSRREILTLSDSPVRSCWAPDLTESDGLPSTPMMAAVVAGMQVDLGLRNLIAANRTDSWTVEVRLDPAPAVERFTVRRSVSCPFHEKTPTLVEPPSNGRATAAGLLESVEGADPVLVLDWPVCTAAICDACGHQWAPLRRLAAFRRYGACPMCASRRVREEESIRTLTRHSAWADSPLAALGLPDRHLYTVRTGDTQ